MKASVRAQMEDALQRNPRGFARIDSVIPPGRPRRHKHLEHQRVQFQKFLVATGHFNWCYRPTVDQLGKALYGKTRVDRLAELAAAISRGELRSAQTSFTFSESDINPFSIRCGGESLEHKRLKLIGTTWLAALGSTEIGYEMGIPRTFDVYSVDLDIAVECGHCPPVRLLELLDWSRPRIIAVASYQQRYINSKRLILFARGPEAA